MYKITDQIIQFIEKTIETWTVELKARGTKLSRSKDPLRHIPERWTNTITILLGGARGVMVIVAGCGHGDTSSTPRHIALIPLGKV